MEVVFMDLGADDLLIWQNPSAERSLKANIAFRK
jgi:hypothetical protein